MGALQAHGWVVRSNALAHRPSVKPPQHGEAAICRCGSCYRMLAGQVRRQVSFARGCDKDVRTAVSQRARPSRSLSIGGQRVARQPVFKPESVQEAIDQGVHRRRYSSVPRSAPSCSSSQRLTVSRESAGGMREAAESVSTDDAMARNDDRQAVVTTSLTDRPGRRSQVRGQFAVPPGRSTRNRGNRVPDAALKFNAPDLPQRKVETKGRVAK